MPQRWVTLGIRGNRKLVTADLDWVNAEADKIDARKPTLKIVADIGEPVTRLDILRADLAELTDRLYTVRVDADDKAGTAKLFNMNVQLTALDKKLARPKISIRGADLAEAQILRLDAQLDALDQKRETALLKQLPDNSNTGGGGGRFGLGLLGGQQSLFGGLSNVGNVHFAIDALAELAAVAVPVTVAIVAFGAALTATGPDLELIYNREKAMYTATDILGQSLPGVNTNLKAMSTALKPGVFQVWGDALTVVNTQSGAFSKLAATAVGWVDKFAARVTVDIGSSTGMFRQLVSSGGHDLQILGGILNSIGGILGRAFNVAQTTHIAEDLLNIVADILKVADAIAKIVPMPILATAAAIHGMWLWGGKLIDIVPGASRLASGFDNMAAKALNAKTGLDTFAVKGLRGVAVDEEGAIVKTGFFSTALAGLSAIPIWGWVAAGALALGGLAFWLTRSQTATQKWIDSINQGIAGASNNNVFNLMAKDVSQANAKIAESSAQIASALVPVKNSITGVSSSLADDFSPALANARDKQQALAAETPAIIHQMSNFGQGVVWIMSTFKVGYPEAIAIANQANVKLQNGLTGNSKAAETARQQITGLVTGFTQLQTPAGVAGKDFEALAFASNDITSKIQQLNSAWDAWIKNVTGSQTTFDTFAQGMDVLNSDSATYSYHLGKLTVRGSQTKAAIDDLTASGINLNQAFMQQVGTLGSMADALRTSNAPMAVQTSNMKAGIAALIPFAAGSKEATAVLFTMAGQVSGPTNGSIADLSKWAGIKAPDALGILKKGVDQATIAASNLAGAVQNLLNVSFQNDVIQSTGASKALAAYTQDLVNNTQTSRSGQTDRANLIADLRKAGFNAKDASTYVDGLSSSLGKIPKSETPQINMTGVGKFSISGGFSSGGIGNSGPNLGLPAPNQSLLHPAAGGWLVSGGTPGVDSVPILAQQGEAVVPRHLTPAVAPFLRAHGVPGFESGGYVGNVQGLGIFSTNMYLQFQTDLANAMVTGMRSAVNAAITSLQNMLAAGSGGGPTSASAGAAQAYARSRLSAYGWGQDQMPPLIALWNQESGWNRLAQNPSSGAYGIPQALPPGKMGSAANPPTSSAGAQIDWGLGYIRSVYGSPGGAEAHEQGFHWYDNGGWIPPGLSLVANGTGAHELVTPMRDLTVPSRGAGGDTNIYITVQASDCVDPNAVAQAIHQRLRRYKTKKGNIKLGLD